MLEYNIGEKLKELRLSKKLTLQTVAAKNGFSPSYISQIENNNVTPPIQTLAKLTKFFGIKIGSLFNENCEEQKYEIIRHNDRKSIHMNHLRKDMSPTDIYESFPFKNRDKKMVPFMITLDENEQNGNTYSYGGEAFLFVLQGAIELMTNGQQFSLEEGDSVYFNTSQEHLFRCNDGSKAKIIEVCCRI